MESTFLIHSRKRARRERLGWIQHVITALLLITTAWPHVEHELNPLAVAELVAGAALILTAIVEKTRKTHARVAWLEIAGALMMYVEAIAKLYEPHHASYRRLSFLPPTVVLILGVFDHQVRERIRFIAGDRGFEYRSRLLKWKRVAWEGVRAYRITPKHIEFIAQDGRVSRVKITDVLNRTEALAWAEEQFRARGLVAAE
ncbi:MAG: hypothetical protein JO315_18270 [Acidobacteria bacterium]|nr:hypothetical protein [Acidobacteriota bacterium]